MPQRDCSSLHDRMYVSHSEEAQEYVEIGSLNGLFVLGRTVGFIGKSMFTADLWSSNSLVISLVFSSSL